MSVDTKEKLVEATDVLIRAARPEDAELLVKIYNPYIEKTTVSYEYEAISSDEMKKRIEQVTNCYPWLVLVKEGQIVAYAYASEFQKRAAFQWDCEMAVYVAENCIGMGYGSVLYEKLLPMLQTLGYRNLYALIDYPNPASEALHRKFGFTKAGLYENTGYKHGAWRSLLSLALHFPGTEPPEAVKDEWRELC